MTILRAGRRGDTDGEGDGILGVLALALGVHTRRAHHVQTVGDGVEKQAHILDDEHRAALLGGRSAEHRLHQGLRLGHGELVPDDPVRRPALRFPIRQAEQGPGVALGTARVPQGGQHLLRQLKEPQLVGDGRLALAQPPGQLLLGQGKVLLQPPQGQGLLPEVQIPALEVFHQGEQGGGLAVGLNGQAGHLTQSRQLGRPKAALPRHQLPAVFPPADCEARKNPFQIACGNGIFAFQPMFSYDQRSKCADLPNRYI